MKLITPYAADFGKPNVTIKHFPDTESYVLIPDIKTYKNQKVTVYHRLFPEPDKRIFELLLIISRLKKETKQIELFVPYLPYARADKENKVGEAVSAEVLCKLFKSYGVKKLITYDCHFLDRSGDFKKYGLTIENRSAGEQLFAYAKKYFAKYAKEKFVVVSPDERASYFTEHAQGHAKHSLRKVRHESKAGEKTHIHADIHTMEGEVDVQGKNVCMLDDIIATGGTMIRAIEHLKSRGAKKIIIGATHGVFAGEKIADKILASSCEKIFITNSIENTHPSVEILRLD